MNYKDINDYELLYMVCDENEDSVEILLKKYQPLIHKKVLKWQGVAKECSLEIEDLEQEIRCSLIEAIRHYDECISATFYTYFSIVIDNTIIRVLRNSNTLKQKILNEAISLEVPIADGCCYLQDLLSDSTSNIENKFMEYQLICKISEFCYGLSFSDASIFELYLSGYSIKIIAQLFTLKIKYVSQVLYRTRKNLKKFLEQNEFLMV